MERPEGVTRRAEPETVGLHEPEFRKLPDFLNVVHFFRSAHLPLRQAIEAKRMTLDEPLPEPLPFRVIPTLGRIPPEVVKILFMFLTSSGCDKILTTTWERTRPHA
jgi:hypothetical protein